MCVKVSIKDLNAKRPYNYQETIIVLNSFLCDFEFFYHGWLYFSFSNGLEW